VQEKEEVLAAALHGATPQQGVKLRVNKEDAKRVLRGMEGNVRSPCDVAAHSS
jgi:hypothetical protein